MRAGNGRLIGRAPLPWKGAVLATLVAFLESSSAAAGSVRERPISTKEIGIGIFVVDVTAIDSARQTFDVNLYVEAQWRDSRLEHTGTVYRRPLEEVWHPRLQFVNRLQVQATLPEEVEISPDGMVTYRQRVLGSFSQRLNLQDFPFDKQRFEILIVALGYTPGEIQFQLLSGIDTGISSTLSIPDWIIRDWKAQPRGYQPLPAGIVDAGFVFLFEAERQTGYFILKIILPLILIVGMSWIVFWIDPKDTGTQISVAVTSMLTLIAYRFMIGREVPNVSYLTRLDYIVLLSTLLVSLALVEAIATAVLVRREHLDYARKFDRLSRFLFPALFALLLAFAVID